MIDEYIITVIPQILTEGIALPQSIIDKLHKTEYITYDIGAKQYHFFLR